jgi:hypothetical protein
MKAVALASHLSLGVNITIPFTLFKNRANEGMQFSHITVVQFWKKFYPSRGESLLGKPEKAIDGTRYRNA